MHLYNNSIKSYKSLFSESKYELCQGYSRKNSEFKTADKSGNKFVSSDEIISDRYRATATFTFNQIHLDSLSG